MSARVEAAANIIRTVHYPDYAVDPEFTSRVLAAADKVMFSDDAVERAAALLARSEGWDTASVGPEYLRPWLARSGFIGKALAVIDVLKGGDA